MAVAFAVVFTEGVWWLGGSGQADVVDNLARRWRLVQSLTAASCSSPPAGAEVLAAPVGAASTASPFGEVRTRPTPGGGHAGTAAGAAAGLRTFAVDWRAMAQRASMSRLRACDGEPDPTLSSVLAGDCVTDGEGELTWDAVPSDPSATSPCFLRSRLEGGSSTRGVAPGGMESNVCWKCCLDCGMCAPPMGGDIMNPPEGWPRNAGG